MKGLSLVVVSLLISPAFSQEVGPEAPILGKGTLGLNGLAVLEVALPTEYSYNPAAVPFALDFFKERQYGEIDKGTLNFEKGPRVENHWYLDAFQLSSRSAVRIAYYTISSDNRPIAYLGPTFSVSFEGETYEMTYGKLISEKLGIGVALIPYEKIRTHLTTNGAMVGQGEAKSDFHRRIGVIYLPDKKLSFGAVYTEDKISASTTLAAELVGLPEPLRLEGNYKEKLLTLGVAFQPKLGTTIFFTRQKGDIKGPNLSEDIDLKTYGVQQFLNPKFSLRVGVYDKSLGYAITYLGRGWNFGLSFSRNTYRRTEQYLGRANTFYFWAGKGF